MVHFCTVSGRSFPKQIEAYMQYLRCGGPRPDLVYGASGGNVVAYIAMAADYDTSEMHRIAMSIDTNLFLEPRTRFVPNIVGLVYGGFHRPGAKAIDFMRSIIDEGAPHNGEIITLVTNKSTGRAELWSNRSAQTSIANLSDSVKYTNGDVSLITRLCSASAAIPLVVEPVLINGSKYIDGGVTGFSPSAVIRVLPNKCVYFSYEDSYLGMMSIHMNAMRDAEIRRIRDNIRNKGSRFREVDVRACDEVESMRNMSTLLSEASVKNYWALIILSPPAKHELSLYNITANAIQTVMKETAALRLILFFQE